MLGEGVGKEIFSKDAHEIMQVMVKYFQAGFAADDQTREYIHEVGSKNSFSTGR